MILALLFILAIVLMIAFAARAIWIDARRQAQRSEATELGIDEDADLLPFRRVGSHAADVVGKIDRRRA